MVSIVQWVHLLALAAWLGSVVFLSFIVAPGVFRTFPVEEAGRIMSVLFPNYYRLGYVCGSVLLVTAIALWWIGDVGTVRWAAIAALAALMLAMSVYAGAVIQPRVHALRAQLGDAAAQPSVKAEFDQLHRRAVQLNGAILLGNLIIAGIFVTRLRS